MRFLQGDELPNRPVLFRLRDGTHFSSMTFASRDSVYIKWDGHGIVIGIPFLWPDESCLWEQRFYSAASI